ncbi:hypothetical protein [Roseomonas marmotae]|uniref:Uncharacterized protein n=1 Tax=Roseomonas marmotae TaxID=2768161 RepID=A0ABS3K6P9_9PROT|nr:hypothetical protein [Roseomonas marmotae]MBO1073135.1 hypothetical protein [Roseomonas marmotae]QTI79229.1 hypothetical protein IAI58_16680 [Roseomonas marmotae]
MFIAPFTRLTTLDLSDTARLGIKEAARQAALLRVPGHDFGHGTRLTELASHAPPAGPGPRDHGEED